MLEGDYGAGRTFYLRKRRDQYRKRSDCYSPDLKSRKFSSIISQNYGDNSLNLVCAPICKFHPVLCCDNTTSGMLDRLWGSHDLGPTSDYLSNVVCKGGRLPSPVPVGFVRRQSRGGFE